MSCAGRVRWCHERVASHSFTLGGTTEIPKLSRHGRSCMACVVTMPRCDSGVSEDRGNRWGSTLKHQVQEGGGGFLCRKCLGRGTGRGFLCRKGGGFCAGRGPGRGQEGSSYTKKGGSCGVPWTVPGQEGGVSCPGRGFLWGSCGASCAHPALTILGRLPFQM